jgi:ATP-binding cassette subfamily B protein
VDRIITLDRGRVDEIGTPQQLAASGGIYAELLTLQASSSKADRKRLEKFGIKI